MITGILDVLPADAYFFFIRTYKSEYASNFMSPAEFEYASGAWKGAPPPHLHSQKASVVWWCVRHFILDVAIICIW